MASPSDRDNQSNKNQTTTENPFIKFRQFADSQISSLLQSIIGLPSTFSRNQTDHPRWADFDEDLRRRDELQARKRELKESEARRLEQEHQEGHLSPVNVEADEEDCGLRDVPLYSAVSQSQFSHLPGFPKDGEKPWTKIIKSYNLGYSPSQDPNPGLLRLTQYMLYDRLATSLTYRSDYSLLPYLLFSPYSPIKLSSSLVARPSPENGMPTMVRDDFPYRQAFQDLINTTYPHHDAPGMNWFWSNFQLGYLERGHHIHDDATRNILWIDNLYLSNILQRKQAHDLDRGDFRLYERTVHGDYLDGKTEQDLYDEFLQWATSPPAVKSVFDLLEDPFKHLKGDSAQPNKGETWEEKHAKAFQDIAGHWEKLQSSTRRELENVEVEKVKSAQDPDKVISSSTTTEQTVDENGCVETCVTVWKRFANGRETTTTTTHMEEPAAEDERKLGKAADSSETRTEKLSSQVSQKNAEKKGWFWN